MGRRRLRALRLLTVPLAVTAMLPVTASPAGGPAASRPARLAKVRREPERATAATALLAGLAPAQTTVATADSTIPAFSQPGGEQTGWVPATWHSALSALPVIAARPGWLQVRLAQRPNESTAWVRRRDVTLSTTQYAIVIDLAAARLTLYDAGRPVFSAPAGVGAPETPTPAGEFFVAFTALPPAPGYGPFVLVTSAHSDSITDWNMSGDAMIAIHGPLGADKQIGTAGAHISHGCIRLHEADLIKLHDIPAGTPVTVLAHNP